MAEGIAIEIEELGTLALVGVVVLPGMIWAAKAKSASGTMRRTLVLAGIIGAALVIEAALDRSANSIADDIMGNN